MGPFLDIYGLTDHRDSETIERLLSKYIDRTALEDMGDSELMMVPLGKSSEEAERTDHYDWEPVPMLTQAIQRGLDYPRRAFSLYLSPTRIQPIDRLILTFTTDNKLVIGLSLPYWENCREQLMHGEKSLKGLVIDFDCSMGLIDVERPPLLSANGFREAMNTDPNILHVWQRETDIP